MMINCSQMTGNNRLDLFEIAKSFSLLSGNKNIKKKNEPKPGSFEKLMSIFGGKK